jgi:small-conductance mechanosensitive channel
MKLAPHAKSEKRISQLTLVFGLLAVLPFAHYHVWRWGIGVLIGAILAWFNFLWLRQGMDALTQASVAQADQQKVQVPLSAYFKAALRYGLMALAVYVIFRYLNVPALSMVVGLCALGAATLVVSVHEILRPVD